MISKIFKVQGLVVISGTLFVAAATWAIFQYQNTRYWKNQYELSLEKSMSEKQNIIKSKLKLSNAQMENTFLLQDYYQLDSSLTEEILKTDNLLSRINEYKNLIATLKEKNNELYQTVGTYRQQIDMLQAAFNKKEQELLMYIEMYEQARANLTENSSVDLTSFEGLVKYKLFSYSAKTVYSVKDEYRATNRAKRAEYVQICLSRFGKIEFDFGNKEVFFRISDSKGNVLPYQDENAGFFKYKGDEIVFTHKENINFSNKLFPICINYKVNRKLETGIYWVDVFSDNIKIGEASFELQ